MIGAAMALARLRQDRRPQAWTFAQAFGSSTIGLSSRLPCDLDIGSPDDESICYHCGETLPHSHKES